MSEPNTNNTESTKSNLRQKLEFLENQVYLSWMRDLDKTKELQEIIKLIDGLSRVENFEAYFNGVTADIVFFFQKFSKDVITNILRQPVVYGENGDEIALIVLTSFLKLFSTLADKSYCATTILECTKEILDPSKSFYKGSFYNNQKYTNPRKQFSADKYNETFLKRKKKTRINPETNEEEEVEYKENEIIDILVDNKKVYFHFNDKKVWVRGLIKEVTPTSYKIFTVEH